MDNAPKRDTTGHPTSDSTASDREVTCSFCGSVYSVTVHRLSGRALNLVDCVICGDQLLSTYTDRHLRFALKRPARLRTGPPPPFAPRTH